MGDLQPTCYFSVKNKHQQPNMQSLGQKMLFSFPSHLWDRCPCITDSSECNLPASATKQPQALEGPTSHRLVMVAWTAQVTALLCIPAFFTLCSWTKAEYCPSTGWVLGGARVSHRLPPRWQRSAASKGLDRWGAGGAQLVTGYGGEGGNRAQQE